MLDNLKIMFQNLVNSKKALLLLVVGFFGVVVAGLISYSGRLGADIEVEKVVKRELEDFSIKAKKLQPLGGSNKNIVLGARFSEEDIQRFNKDSYILKYKLPAKELIEDRLGIQISYIDDQRVEASSKGSFSDFLDRYTDYLNSTLVAASLSKDLKFELKSAGAAVDREYAETKVESIERHRLYLNGSPVLQLSSIKGITVYRLPNTPDSFRIVMPAFFISENVLSYKRGFKSGVYNVSPFTPVDPSLSTYLLSKSPKLTLSSFSLVPNTSGRLFIFDNKQGALVPVLSKEATLLVAENVKNPNYIFISIEE